MARLSQDRIMIVGGTGFIGSHLVQRVSDDFDTVVVDLSIHPRSYFLLENLKKKVILDFCDITDKEKIEKVILTYQPSYIFHLAAEPIVEKAYADPYLAFNTNIMGTVNVLEAARKLKNLKGVIVASSDKAYGKSEKAYNEESPLRGDHPYDVSKSAADLISQTYYKTYQLPVVITRFGNVYGEGDIHFNRIIPGICKAVIENKELMIRSDGTYVRDYLYVKDVVDGYLFLMKNLARVKGEAYNFSSKDTLSVLNLIKKSEKALGSKIEYQILNVAKNEIPYQHLNDKKIKKLGWNNKYDVKKILPQVLDWYRKFTI